MNLKDANNYIEQNRVAGALRPLFHIIPEVGWMNDPNGFSEYKGEYHLFYQHYPYGTQWGPMHWGHVRSKDFITWEALPVALAPDEEYDCQGCFSGTALQVGDEHVLVYTGVSEGKQKQCVAIGTGTDYVKIPENPVIPGDMLPEGFSRVDFRDPKIYKVKEGYELIAVNFSEKNLGQLVKFSTKDLRNWQYEGVVLANDGSLGVMWECPDYFTLDGQEMFIFSPQDVAAVDDELHNGDNSVYTVRGSGKFHEIDYGLDFYAPQTAHMSDGRQILIGWMHSWKNDYAPAGVLWNGMMTLPRELKLIDGIMYQTPVKELANYHLDKVEHELILDGAGELPKVKGRTADMCIRWDANKDLKVSVAVGDGHHTDIIYDASARSITFDRRYSGITKDINCLRTFPVHGNDALMSLRIVLDYNSVELFVNDGREAFSGAIWTDRAADGIVFNTKEPTKLSVTYHNVGRR